MNRIRNIIFLLIMVISVLIVPYKIHADGKTALTQYDAYTYCSNLKAIKETDCTNNGCQVDSGDDVNGYKCVSRDCTSISLAQCNEYKYCISNSKSTKNERNKCGFKVSCAEDKCLPEDDYGKKCNNQSTDCGVNNIVSQNLGFNVRSYLTVCQNLWKMNRNDLLSGGTLESYCERMAGGSQASYQACLSSGQSTVNKARSDYCGSASYCTKANEIPYKEYDNNGTLRTACTCKDGYEYALDSNFEKYCKRSGSGSGVSCVNPTGGSFVASYAVENVCTAENNCELADCSGGGDANPFDKSRGSKFDTGVQKITGLSSGDKSYAQAWRYRGSCNNKNTDVFCIDPGAKYHDNNAGYTCKSSMNTNSTIDAGYVKIYQLALDKYVEMYANGDKELTDDQYQGIHFAYRFWTFYTNMDRAESSDVTIADDNNIYAYTNSEISHGFNGTSFRIAGTNTSESAYFIAKHGINGYDYSNRGSMADAGYRDSVEFFRKTATGEADIWVNPLEFVLITKDMKNGTATVMLRNIQALRDSRFLDSSGNPKYNFVNNIYCKEAGCTITEINGSNDYLRAGVDSVTFKVKFSGKSFTVGVNYYDKRDGKNVILATAGQPTEYQRLVFVTSALAGSQTRIFKLEKNFSGDSKIPCTITGTSFTGIDGRDLKHDYQTYSRECCDTHLIDEKDNDGDNKIDHQEYCDALKTLVGTNHSDYKTACVSPYKEYWAQKGCPTTCSPNNTLPKDGSCYKMEGDTVVISDLTDDNTLGMPGTYFNSDNYCISCVDSSNATSSSNTNYSHRSFEQFNYCDIYCVEEYKFNVPKNLTVNGEKSKYGRYLQLEVPTTAKRICYTDTKKTINYTQFNTDINQQKQNVDNAIDELNRLNTAYNLAKAAYDNGDPFNPSAGGVCQTTKEEEAPACPYGTTYGTTKCPNSCEECTKEVNGGCVASKCVNASGKETRNVSVNCDNNPKPMTYSYSANGYSHTSSGSCSGCNTNNGSRENVLQQFKDARDAQYKVVQAEINLYDTIISHYNTCYNFDSGSCINNSGENAPYIDYTYEEEYYMSILKPNNKLTSNNWSTSTTRKYHETINTRTNNCTYTDSGTSTPKMSTTKYKRFVASGDTFTLDTDANAFSVPVSKYSYLSETKSATLKPSATWYTKVGTGSATLKKEKNTVYLGNVLPISRVCLPGETKKFKYILSFMNLGQESNSCNLGRLNKVLKVQDSKNQYVCDYELSNKGCIGCEDTYFFRPISLTDVFPKSGLLIENASKQPNGRDYRPDTSVKQEKLPNERGAAPNWTTAKGKQTQQNIEKLGEDVYKGDTYLEYSYTITPAGMKQIRTYNSDKTYNDESYKCDEAGIKCTSEFLDLISQNKYSGVKENKRNPNYQTYTDGTVWH